MSQAEKIADALSLRIGRWLNVRLSQLGVQLASYHPPGHSMRPIGRLRSFLQDIAARGYNCRRVLDMGASDGSWSRELLRVFPDAEGLLVEPRAECVPELRRFCEEHPAWSYVNVALGEGEGQSELTSWGTSSTLLRENVARADETVTVNVKTCDSLIGTRVGTDPDLVKLDVEGLELPVLRGGETLFGRTELFVIEVATMPFGTNRPLLHDVVRFMAERGYLFYDVAGCIRRPLDGAVGLLDIAFARRNGSLARRDDAW